MTIDNRKGVNSSRTRSIEKTQHTKVYMHFWRRTLTLRNSHTMSLLPKRACELLGHCNSSEAPFSEVSGGACRQRRLCSQQINKTSGDWRNLLLRN